MIIGVPKETKTDEYRVALRPVGADLLRADGHEVLIERGAGRGSGYADRAYAEAGATIVESAEEVFRRAELIVKVKEPLPPEIEELREGQVVFTYFHFAASRELTEGCLRAGISAMAYETLRDRRGRLPLLTPMSEVAGRMSIQEGAKHLERPMHGRGILLGGVPGVEPASVLVVGAGVVGANAARIAAGFGANVVLMDIDLDRLRALDDIMPANVTTLYSDPHELDAHTRKADLVIGAVLVPGGRAPHLIHQRHIERMRHGAVVVDVCIDQGGCIATSRPTTHREPTFIVDGVVHYCVANMPGAVGRTSTQALCNATLPYIRELAGLGVERFTAQSEGHAAALNLHAGRITHPALADTFDDLPQRA